jgi:uncharacterized RDD family membrane protein YckC
MAQVSDDGQTIMMHEIISTEKVPIVYRVAGLGARFLAWLVDLQLMLAAFLFIGLYAQVWEIARQGLGIAVFAVVTFVVQWGYFVLWEWLWYGQTPGKRLVGIRVIDWQGSSMSFGQAAVRNVLRVADGLPLLVPDFMPVLYGVGFLVAACNREQRRLGDLAAGTLVVYVEARTQALQELLQQEIARGIPRQQMWRQRLEQLGRTQKQTLLDLCQRREQLRLRERTRLFTAVADYFRQHLDLAPQATQSDEKFILQLAAVLSAQGEPGVSDDLVSVPQVR